LKGLPLKDLSIEGTAIHDLTALAGMQLKKLTVAETPFTDADLAAAVTGKVLAEQMDWLHIGYTKITSIEALRGISVVMLFIQGTSVSDLSPVAGRQGFHTLDFRRTNVSDLKPLKGMSMEILSIAGCPVTSISPLADITVRLCLDIAFCSKIKDLDKLPEYCPQLDTLGFAVGQVSPGQIRRFPRLEYLHVYENSDPPYRSMTVAEFLKNPPAPKGR